MAELVQLRKIFFWRLKKYWWLSVARSNIFSSRSLSACLSIIMLYVLWKKSLLGKGKWNERNIGERLAKKVREKVRTGGRRWFYWTQMINSLDVIKAFYLFFLFLSLFFSFCLSLSFFSLFFSLIFPFFQSLSLFFHLLLFFSRFS